MRICIVYPLAFWLEGYPCGGAEKQVGLLAQHLTLRGHDVTFVTTAHPGRERVAGGVHVRPAWDASRGLRWVRGVTYRLPSLKAVLQDVAADVYYVRSTMSYARWVVSAAHAVHAPFMLGLASDLDLTPESGHKLVSGAGRAGAELAWLLLQRKVLRGADVVITQNEEQARRCERLGLPHVLIPSIVEVPDVGFEGLETAPDVVWAGHVHSRARQVKGLEALASLVAALPHVTVAILGSIGDDGVVAGQRRLVELPNTQVLGALPFSEAQRCIASSRLVVNTSSSEGFSNVMLEGWALRKPSVTLAVNPNGLLASGHWPGVDIPKEGFRSSLGGCAEGDGRLLANLIRAALEDHPGRAAIGERCREYILATHSPSAVCSRYEELAIALRA